MRPDDWSEMQRVQLTTLVREGKSFGAIASVIGRSRNACLGKAHRIGLQSRVKICERIKPSERMMTIAEIAEPVVNNVESGNTRCTIIELTDIRCRFPLWSIDAGENDRFYCGRASARLSAGRPYCARHTQIAANR